MTRPAPASDPAAPLARLRLRQALDDAAVLMRSAACDAWASGEAFAAPQADVLARCIAVCESSPAPVAEPLRTLHHFACTGGTLISRCIACMPNVQLLSELDPLSPGPAAAGKPRFAPTDMVAQLRQSTRGTDRSLILDLFRSDLRVILADAASRGQRLVVRDHSHSHFCRGPAVAERPTLLQIVSEAVPALALVTVRHPLDAFASLSLNGWLQFSPPTLDEYCHRHLQFLDAYAGVPVVRYEDFVDSPMDTMGVICRHLDLPFQPHFEELYQAFHITGDSGRAGRRIARHPRQAEATARLPEALKSHRYIELCERLRYDVGTDLAPT